MNPEVSAVVDALETKFATLEADVATYKANHGPVDNTDLIAKLTDLGTRTDALIAELS